MSLPSVLPPHLADRILDAPLWTRGREAGHEVVALGIALALSIAVLDVALVGHLSVVFDLCFVALALTLALRVRPTDFFTVGVSPPLIMAGLFILLSISNPETLAHPDDGVVQAVVSGLSRHSAALVAGYALCLGCLAVRQRVQPHLNGRDTYWDR